MRDGCRRGPCLANGESLALFSTRSRAESEAIDSCERHGLMPRVRPRHGPRRR
ncbi:hypothetical protein [Pseudomonas sp. LRF_L74]|uniref:hypothetical protein n=1 Tax=Pseudomonas sp. LRF_L74 TaxID=3369422 RepID=UPI003F622FC8